MKDITSKEMYDMVKTVHLDRELNLTEEEIIDSIFQATVFRLEACVRNRVFNENASLYVGGNHDTCDRLYNNLVTRLMHKFVGRQ